ncbi:MAG: helix-hairpin-helix domain-containing protein [Phycisphaerales bacterium]|nr:helix-hairpin-helix domain-containing protein [Phycisphaerales bacterium]
MTTPVAHPRAADAAPPVAAPLRGLAAWLIVANLIVALCAFAPGRAPRGGTPSSESAALRIDPNTATQAELTLLPGVGPKLADAIIAYRQAAPRKPAFRNAVDLDLVPRIGPSILERSQIMLRFPPGDDPSETRE